MRIVYIASLLTYDGVEHIGQSLTRHFQTEHDICVVGAIAAAHSELHSTRVSDRVMPVEDLDGVDIVYMEGGWTDGSGGVTERFPLDLAETFVRGGGQLIVADVDRNSAVKHRDSLLAAARMFGAVPSFNQPLGGAVCYLHDPGSEERSGTRFFISEMTVSDRMAPALVGVDSLIAAGTVALQPISGDIAASGNRSSTLVLAKDLWVDLEGAVPWAMTNAFGHGHAVLIAGRVSADTNLEHCPDNARWISNMMTLLSDRTRESQRWSAPFPTHNQDSASDLRALLPEPESECLERKSSFLVPTDPTRSDVDRRKIQHAVGKSIAALANTVGGHVIIGQADDKSILGLDGDFGALGKNNDQDGFTQALLRYVDQNLSQRYEVLGLKVHWISENGRDVAVIEVPRQPSHTIVTVKNPRTGSQDVYVGRGTQSDPIADQVLFSWIQSRK